MLYRFLFIFQALLEYERHKVFVGEVQIPLAIEPEPMNIDNQVSFLNIISCVCSFLFDLLLMINVLCVYNLNLRSCRLLDLVERGETQQHVLCKVGIHSVLMGTVKLMMTLHLRSDGILYLSTLDLSPLLLSSSEPRAIL